MKILVTAFLLFAGLASAAAAQPTVTIDGQHPAGKVSPMLYGLMTEEINFCYDGGLYAELVRNRAFLDNPEKPEHWSVVSGDGASASIALDPGQPLSAKIATSLRLEVAQASGPHPAGVANGGYWGIPVYPNTTYKASVYARAAPGFTGPLGLSIQSVDGRTLYAHGEVRTIGSAWRRYDITLHTGRVPPTSLARFAVTLDRPGTVWLGLVSLFPPTWNDRPNGLRRDLMQLLVDLKPKFLRFPGGNYLEGDTVATRFEWKKTLGPLVDRPGHAGPWGYRSTDGMGLLEFLLWCEDMGAEPVLAVYAGYSLQGAYVKPGSDLAPFVEEALEEIEYVTGGPETKWGAQRTKDGHPAPFPLRYVEIGNEDWFDKSLSYDGRFAQFYDAIKARHPQLKIISSVGNEQPAQFLVHSRQPDVVDEHYYRSIDEFLKMAPDYYEKYNRHQPAIFVGEWATHEDSKVRPWFPQAKAQPPTPDMKDAIGDAAWMAAMERNSDLVIMHGYAPLLVNVSSGARQWRPDLIGYDALRAYGSPSYHALALFSRHLGDELLPVTRADTAVQASATRDSRTGRIFLKLVNPQPVAERLAVQIRGVAALGRSATSFTLAAAPAATNTIEAPSAVVPVATPLPSLQPSFTYDLPATSIVILSLPAR